MTLDITGFYRFELLSEVEIYDIPQSISCKLAVTGLSNTSSHAVRDR